jgi:hypothetical protein
MKLNKFKVAANTLMTFKKLGLHHESSDSLPERGENHSNNPSVENLHLRNGGRDSNLSKGSKGHHEHHHHHHITAAEAGLIGRSYGVKPGQAN